MKQINLLSQETIDQIAAGEVVERPASVVKELVENAVDAGANAVTVEIRDGGTTFIRITDNGEGIDRNQIRTAFLRHATSKIRSAQDLETVGSLGFRGEALSSISSVSRMELITKTPGSLIGSRYLIEGGEEKSFDEIGAPEGSTFLVKDLFFNTPVRKKFLKSPTTEGNYISDLMEHLALAHPEISFKLIAGGQTKLYTSGNHNLKDVIYSIYGRQIAQNLIPVEWSSPEEDGMKITGFIGKPDISRGNRNYENYYINGRYIRSQIIAKGIEEGYKGYMMLHRYPFTVLHITMDGPEVDVNVHPTKMEVRFADNELLYNRFQSIIRGALSHKELIPNASVKTEQDIRKEIRQETQERLHEGSEKPEPFEKLRRDFLQKSDSPYQPRYPEHRTQSSHTDFTSARTPVGEARAPYKGPAPVLKGSFQRTEPSKQEHTPELTKAEETELTETAAADTAAAYTTPAASQSEPENSGHIPDTEDAHLNPPKQLTAKTAEQQKSEQLSLFEDERLLAKENRPHHRLIGQLFQTYWLIEFRDSLYIIDQHAAHEKVRYERLMKQFADKTYTSQQISPPLIVTLTPHEQDRLETYRSFFEQIGFVIEPFGGHEFIINAVPDNLYGFSDKDLFTQMLDELQEDSTAPAEEMLNHKIATMACKSAVKGGMKLSFAEADALIEELLTLENPYHCPHGRPTIIAISRQEMEKKFKRIV